MVINGFSYKKQASISEHNQSRTEFFFDAVIAIAITMFALEIDVPGGDIFDWQSLKILFGEITTYFISFIVLSSIWVLHAQIYSRWKSLGNLPDLILNIILMFLITLFPVLTKLMAGMQPGLLLNMLYLGCYGLMLALTLGLQVLARRSDDSQYREEFHTITGYLKLFKDKIQSEKYGEIYRKMELTEKYMDDPATFDLLYQEFVAALPEHIRTEIRLQRHSQKIQYYKVIIFYIVVFTAISLSVLAMMVNPYYCYPIILVAVLLSVILGIGLDKYKKHSIH